VLSHEGAGGALRALLLELLDLAVSLNREVLKDLLGALLVSMLDLLGGGVDLLFALTLATLGVNQGGDGALALETGTGDGELVLKLSGTENNAVDVAFGLLLNFGSKGSNRVGSLDINYKLLASRSLHENLQTYLSLRPLHLHRPTLGNRPPSMMTEVAPLVLAPPPPPQASP